MVVDAISNSSPPFSIPAGTRINVYSPVDLVVTCGTDEEGKKCNFVEYSTNQRRPWAELKKLVEIDTADSSWIGQVRSWDLEDFCKQDPDDNNKWTIKDNWATNKYGYDYRTILLYCESKNYVAKNMAKNALYTEQKNKQFTEKYGTVNYTQGANGKLTVDQSGMNDEQKKAYNEDMLGLQYAEDGTTLLNPFAKPKTAATAEEVLTCDDGSAPDANGCCTGETYTDMGEQGFNCCPDTGGDCFPPIEVQ